MSNQPYDNFRYRLLTADVDWPTLATKLVLTAWGGVPLYNPQHATIAALRTAIAAQVPLGDQFEIKTSEPNNYAAVRFDGTAVTDYMMFIEVPVGTKISWFTLSEMVPSPTDGALVPSAGSNKLICFLDEGEFLPFYANGLRIIVSPDWFYGRGWFRP